MAHILIRPDRRIAGNDLASRPKGDALKVTIALRLRQETTMTVAWIVARLKMGPRDGVNNLLSRKRKEKRIV